MQRTCRSTSQEFAPSESLQKPASEEPQQLNPSVASCLALRPLLNINLQPRLYHEECRVVLDGRLGMHKPESVPPQDLG
jgi:hypothetical protein